MLAYGIDLGTTNSCIAVIDGSGEPHVLKNLDNEHTTPSVVFFDQMGQVFVGTGAKNQMASEPERSVAFIKRKMSDPAYRLRIDSKTTVSPAEVSALVLKKMVDDANELRRDEGLPEIHHAVITVPAYFGTSERELTRQAGYIAGLEVVGLINEPTAAALSYGAKSFEGKTVMVYDLGGGTFDVSIMRCSQGQMDTLATDGNQRLGGVDWDEALLDYALHKQGVQLSIDDVRQTKDYAGMMIAAENCKKRLSRADSASLRFMCRGRVVVAEITRMEFEDITQELLNQTMAIIDHAFTVSRVPLGKSDIDEIVLVGGSSYMPMVKRRLKQDFSCPIRLDRFEPDLAVAQGAAIYAAQCSGVLPPSRLGKDMSSRSYGMFSYDRDTNKPRVFNLIKRTDDLVFDNYRQFCTRNPRQTAATISIYENTSNADSIDPSEANLLEEKEISWGFPVPADTEIEVHIVRGKDGIVHIEVECQQRKITFKITPRGLLAEPEIEALRSKYAGMRI